MDNSAHVISIVIPTKNSSTTLAALFDSIRTREQLKIEAIVADDSSGDGTAEICERYGARMINIVGPRTKARNFGTSESSGEYIMNLDSDMTLEPGLIDECFDLCEKQGVDAVIIPEVNVGFGYWGRCLGLEKLIVRNEPGYEACRFIRRDVFEAVGGYDENLVSGEDYDLHRRIASNRYAIGTATVEIMHHIGRPTFRELRAKYRFYGETIDRYREKSDYQTGDFILLCYRKKHALMIHPLQALGFLLLKLVEYINQK